MNIGQQIAKYRAQSRITQERLGELIGVSNRTVSKWESGASLPGVDIIPRIASSLGISLDELFGIEVQNGYDTSEMIRSAVKEAINSVLPKAIESAIEDILPDVLEDNASHIATAPSGKNNILILCEDGSKFVECVGKAYVNGPLTLNGKAGVYSVMAECTNNTWFDVGRYNSKEAASDALKKIYNAISNGLARIEL